MVLALKQQYQETITFIKILMFSYKKQMQTILGVEAQQHMMKVMKREHTNTRTEL